MPNVSSLICQHYEVHKEVAKQLSLRFINDAHQKIGHEAQNKSANVTQEACHLFLTFCEECHKKRARKLPKSLVVKPLVSTNLMSRAQVDLINFQTMPDGDFKYIMTYLNHFTKFCILSPLMLKRAEEVASKLLKIFLTFGAPSILQSDNGQEFSYVIIAELKTCWPELKLVTDKLAIWMRENGCKRWSMGLKFVQWQINVSIHETTGQSPFKVTFGEEPRIGLESYVLPKSLVDAAKTEEEIEEFLTSHEANDEDSLNRDGKNYDENESSIMKHLPETFIKARKEAALGQTRAAAKMTRRTKKMLIPLQIGQNCTLRVPDVDRGPADSKNFLVVVRNVKDCTLLVAEKENWHLSLQLQIYKTAVTKATGGQGYVKCMCLSGCSSGRCSCSRKSVLCNSRCHTGNNYQ
ncbi:KRAB-A domain-containing protein 2 [Trichinella nativa]|uniref:KRAB-A domain-containing protein 2 n=1 Tax=Trichinella nativa TaxID=6335 RepID=A0A0V1KNQ4_9BILA|nr:KRAB-A domain-containing protein 2 [Trichinella nativa]